MAKKETKCLIMQMRPPHLTRRDERTYKEPAVKRILKAYTHDYDRARGLEPWPDKDTEEFIETAFDFD